MFRSTENTATTTTKDQTAAAGILGSLIGREVDRLAQMTRPARRKGNVTMVSALSWAR